MLKRPSISITLFTISVIVSVTHADNSKRINYNDAVSLALKHNPKIGISHVSIDSASAAITKTRGKGLPKFNLELSGANSDNPLSVFGYKLSQGNVTFADFGLQQYNGLGSLYTKPSSLNHPGNYNNFNTGLVLNVPIYTGGKNQAELKSRKALLSAAYQGDQAARTSIAYDLLQAYEGALTAKRLVNIASKNVSAAKSYLRTTNSLYKESIVLDTDVILAQNYLRAAKSALYSAKIQSQNQLDTFQTLLGNLNNRFIPNRSTHLSIKNQNIDEVLQEALQSNTHLRALHEKIKSSRYLIDAAKSKNKPQINLQVRQDWNGDSVGNGLPSNTIALGLDWQLFSFGEQTGTINEAVSNHKKAIYEFEEAINQLKLSVIEAQRAIKMSDIEYRTHSANSFSGGKMLAKLSKRYGRGLVPLGQILETQMKLTQAEGLSAQAQYHKILAQGRLLSLTNTLVPVQVKG